MKEKQLVAVNELISTNVASFQSKGAKYDG